MNSRVILGSLGLIFFAACADEQPTSPPSGTSAESETNVAPPRFDRPGVGDVLEPFDALTLDGNRWRFDAGARKLTMINLWATWCVPCREEIPELVDLHDEWSSKGLEIVGVSLDSPGMADQIRQYTESVNVNYTIVHDPRQGLLMTLKTPVIPTTALIDSEGEILWMHLGMVRGDDPSLSEVLTTILDPSSSS